MRLLEALDGYANHVDAEKPELKEQFENFVDSLDLQDGDKALVELKSFSEAHTPEYEMEKMPEASVVAEALGIKKGQVIEFMSVDDMKLISSDYQGQLGIFFNDGGRISVRVEDDQASTANGLEVDVDVVEGSSTLADADEIKGSIKEVYEMGDLSVFKESLTESAIVDDKLVVDAIESLFPNPKAFVSAYKKGYEEVTREILEELGMSEDTGGVQDAIDNYVSMNESSQEPDPAVTVESIIKTMPDEDLKMLASSEGIPVDKMQETYNMLQEVQADKMVEGAEGEDPVSVYESYDVDIKSIIDKILEPLVENNPVEFEKTLKVSNEQFDVWIELNSDELRIEPSEPNPDVIRGWNRETDAPVFVYNKETEEFSTNESNGEALPMTESKSEYSVGQKITIDGVQGEIAHIDGDVVGYTYEKDGKEETGTFVGGDETSKKVKLSEGNGIELHHYKDRAVKDMTDNLPFESMEDAIKKAEEISKSGEYAEVFQDGKPMGHAFRGSKFFNKLSEAIELVHAYEDPEKTKMYGTGSLTGKKEDQNGVAGEFIRFDGEKEKWFPNDQFKLTEANGDISTFSLINVSSEKDGSVDGYWIQDHIGTFETARKVADETEKVNSNSTVAVVKAIGGGSPRYDKITGLKKLTEANGLDDGQITTYADMIVENANGEVLLLQRTAEDELEPSKNGLAGGKVQEGETTEEAAIRETKEEAGVDVSEVFKVMEVVNEDGSTSHYYKGKMAEGDEITLSDEHDEHKFIKPEEMVEQTDIIFDNVARYQELMEKMVEVAEPGNTGGRGGISPGNNPADGDDKSKGSGEVYDKIKKLVEGAEEQARSEEDKVKDEEAKLKAEQDPEKQKAIKDKIKKLKDRANELRKKAADEIKSTVGSEVDTLLDD